MRNNVPWAFSLILAILFVTVVIFEYDAHARAGGGRSSGSSGSRSYSAPNRSASDPVAPSQPPAPMPAQPTGGGFFRSMAGGLIGGMLGGMLFSSLGFGGTGGGIGGSGIGLVEIILLGALGYFIYTVVKRKREGAAIAYQGSAQQGSYTAERFSSSESMSPTQTEDTSLSEGIRHIRQMDPSFDDVRFKDIVMDIFFRIQGAWAHRDLAPVNSMLTAEMKNIFQQDIDTFLREKKVNRLENIAVRKVELVEVWQETGQDFIKTMFTANLLDYTTDEATGTIVAGSKTEPVKFEECWTFTRPVGSNPWKLSAISQV
jgi:predicted lipid-binding transport protein (Tim44 family)